MFIIYIFYLSWMRLCWTLSQILINLLAIITITMHAVSRSQAFIVVAFRFSLS